VISLIREKFELNIQYENIMKYLTDLAEAKLKEKYPNIVLKDLMGDIKSYDLKEVNTVAGKNGLNNFYYIKSTIVDNVFLTSIKLYDWHGKIIYEDNFKFEINKNKKIIVTQEKEDEWIAIFINATEKILEKNERKMTKITKSKLNYKYDHDFPLIGISVSALSVKIYFDDRINSKIQKIFSLSPLDFRLAFFPLRYMETGLFCRLDFNNMVYIYYDVDKKKNKYFDTTFLFGYGLFVGVSFFKDNLHFSFGGQIYNLYYDIAAFPEWTKTNDVNGHFLPQFAVYYKLDFKLLKLLYFSVFVNFKTLPKFELNNGYFYSRPFLYDSFCLEVSFTGITIMF
jgi:hypothetical protein